MSGYICGVMNVVVLLQWAQVYRVICNPSRATNTFVTNWAIKMECTFVTFFTLVMVGSIYTNMYDHLIGDSDHDNILDVTRTTFQIINSVTRLIVILLYVVLLYLFNRLIVK